MSQIFINYRRHDSHAAGRIADRLISHFGEERVFIDVETIRPGADFLEAIEAVIRESGVMVSIIGPDWARLTDESGAARLADPQDPVRLEIEMALEHELPILPVLVEGAKMPAASDLPEGLAAISRRHAVTVAHERFRQDTTELIEAAEHVVGPPVDQSAQAPRRGRSGAPSSDVTIGVIGDGLGALLVYTTAIYLGFRAEQVGIFGEQANPLATYQQFAWNLGQTVLRSESESHFLPADWPTFAQIDAVARRDPSPLLRSVGRKFNPGVPEILTEAAIVTKRLGYESRVLGGTKVGWVVREPGPPPCFSLYDEEANLVARCKHAMIAIGHGPLSFPGIYGEARKDPELRERIVQAYEPKRYISGGRYLTLGSGIASVNEWVNAIDAGAQVIALRRNPNPEEQDLNVPRCLFDGSGIDAFQGLSFDQRVEFLGPALRGTSPARRGWAERIRQAEEEGMFEEAIGEVVEINPGPSGLRVRLRLHSGFESEIDLTGIVCGTGFVKSAFSLPLLRRLAQTYDVPVERERIKLKTNCGIPPLDREDSRLCMMGIAANTVVPNGDTIAGLKYIARRFVGDVARAEDLRQRPFASRLAMQLGLARRTVRAVRRVRKTEQLA